MVSGRIARGPSAAVWTGLVAGPLVWAVNTELGQILPYAAACTQSARLLAIASFAFALLSLLTGAWSWQAARGAAAEAGSDARTLIFGGRIGALIGVTFAFALLLQGASSLMMNGCEG